MGKLIKENVLERLRTFIKEEFGSISEAAEILEIPENTLRYSYLNGKSYPGFEALYQLMINGCDLIWLITGKKDYITMDVEMYQRVKNLITKLEKLFAFSKDNFPEFVNPFKEDGNAEDEEKMTAYFLLKSWYENESLRLFEIAALSRLTDESLHYLLTGDDSDYEKYMEGLFLSYPEIELLVQLKNDPELFKQIQNYVKAKALEKDMIKQSIKQSIDMLGSPSLNKKLQENLKHEMPDKKS